MIIRKIIRIIKIIRKFTAKASLERDSLLWLRIVTNLSFPANFQFEIFLPYLSRTFRQLLVWMFCLFFVRNVCKFLTTFTLKYLELQFSEKKKKKKKKQEELENFSIFTLLFSHVTISQLLKKGKQTLLSASNLMHLVFACFENGNRRFPATKEATNTTFKLLPCDVNISISFWRTYCSSCTAGSRIDRESGPRGIPRSWRSSLCPSTPRTWIRSGRTFA